MYDPVMVQPMRDEVVRIGMKEMKTADEVEAQLSAPGTAFVFINSVCGCAAGGARPALKGMELRRSPIDESLGSKRENAR